MRKTLLAGFIGMSLIASSAANATSFALVTLGFVFGTYANNTDCMSAGASITSSVGGGYIPNYYCVPMTNQTTPSPAVGGGYSSDTNHAF